MEKSLENIIREKLATGYDPIKLSVKSKAMNEENIEVLIEGHHYSINGNTVTQIYKKKKDAPAPASESELASAGERDGDAGLVGSVAGSPSVNPVAPPAGDPSPVGFDARGRKIMNAFDGEFMRAINEDTAKTYGELVYEVVNGQTVIATGTLEELEAAIAVAEQNKFAQGSAA